MACKDQFCTVQDLLAVDGKLRRCRCGFISDNKGNLAFGEPQCRQECLRIASAFGKVTRNVDRVLRGIAGSTPAAAYGIYLRDKPEIDPQNSPHARDRRFPGCTPEIGAYRNVHRHAPEISITGRTSGRWWPVDRSFGRQRPWRGVQI